MSKGKNYKNVFYCLLSSIANIVIKYEIAENSTKIKRSWVWVSEWEKENGVNFKKTWNRAEEVLSWAEEDNCWIWKSERANIFEWSQKRWE